MQLMKQDTAAIVEVPPLSLSLILASVLLAVGNRSPEFGVRFCKQLYFDSTHTYHTKLRTVFLSFYFVILLDLKM